VLVPAAGDLREVLEARVHVLPTDGLTTQDALVEAAVDRADPLDVMDAGEHCRDR
jgi:hypothetical protein